MPFNTTQLQKIKDFWRKKAEEYNIKLDENVPLEINAHYLRHFPTPCHCVECQSVLNIMVTNTLLHPDEIFLELQIPEVNDHIKTFHQLICPQAKKIIAAKIIDLSISHCTNAAEFTLNNSSLLVFQYCIDDTDTTIPRSKCSFSFEE